MPNLFFRTNVAPYRIDTYNAFHERLNCELFFYWDEDHSQKIDMQVLKGLCRFIPHILKGFEINVGKKKRKICTEIWKIIKENNPNFVIVPEFQVVTLQVILYRFFHRSKFKIVSMCDDSYDMIVNNNDFSLIHKIARRIVTPMLDDIILLDSRTVKWYQEHYGKGVWLPIIRDESQEEQKYKRLLPKSKLLFEQYELKGKKIILYVGRLVKLKNLERLIAAFDKIKKQNAVLVIIGNGIEENNLKKISKNVAGKIIFTGHLEGDNLYAWYNVADVFCLVSYQEAYGAVTNEALLAGCHVVISEKAGSACIVNEQNGEVVNPLSIDDIAIALDRQLKKCPLKETITHRSHLMEVEFDERIDHLKEVLTIEKKYYKHGKNSNK